MPLGTLFWVIFVVSILFCGFGAYRTPAGDGRWGYGGLFIVMILIAILGWHEFGGVIR